MKNVRCQWLNEHEIRSIFDVVQRVCKHKLQSRQITREHNTQQPMRNIKTSVHSTCFLTSQHTCSTQGNFGAGSKQVGILLHFLCHVSFSFFFAHTHSNSLSFVWYTKYRMVYTPHIYKAQRRDREEKQKQIFSINIY